MFAKALILGLTEAATLKYYWEDNMSGYDLEDFAPIVSSYCSNTNYAPVCNDYLGFCMDEETSDYYGEYCRDYWGNPDWCGQYDTADFRAREMCCACDGGEQVNADGVPIADLVSEAEAESEVEAESEDEAESEVEESEGESDDGEESDGESGEDDDLAGVQIDADQLDEYEIYIKAGYDDIENKAYNVDEWVTLQ